MRDISLEKHPMWKGGITIHNGYRMIKMPSHPFCRKSGYIMEHRIVMEKTIGRYLIRIIEGGVKWFRF